MDDPTYILELVEDKEALPLDVLDIICQRFDPGKGQVSTRVNRTVQAWRYFHLQHWHLSSVGAQQKSNNWSSESFAKLTLGLAPAVFSLTFFIDQSVEWGNHFYNMKGHLIEKSQGLPIMPIVKT